MTQVERYLEFLEYGRQFSKNTLRDMKSDLETFDGNLDEALRYEVENYIMKENKRGMSSATINRRISTMRNYIQWLIDNDLRSGKNPITKHMTPRVRHKHHEGITESELKDLYNKVSDDVKYFLNLSAWAGLRISEVVSVNEILHDLNGDPYIHLKNTKNGYDRKVSIKHVPDIELVKEVVAQGGLQSQRGKRTANSLYRLVRSETGRKPHDFRSTFSKIAVERGLEINTLRTILGHTEMQGLNRITANYIGETPVEQQSKELMEVFG